MNLPLNLPRLAVVLAVALPLALFCAMSWLAYKDNERTAVARLEDLTRVMEEHAERAFDTNATVFRQLEHVLNGDSDARVLAREAQLRELFDAICDRLPHIASISVLSVDDRVLVSNGADGATAYFRVRHTRASGGEIELALEPSHFTEFYGRLGKAGERLQLRLVSGAGTVLAGAPAVPGYYEVSRGVGTYPFFVVASQPREVVLAPWRVHTAVLAAIAIPSALALFIASFLAFREMRIRMRAEEALRHSQKMEALGELTGGVAHDFGNVLAVVQNSTHLVELMSPQLRDSKPLTALRKAIESGTRLTHQLLTFSRRQPLNPQVISLQRSLPAMVDLLKTTAGSRIAVGLHVAPDTPAIEVDPNELEMALINLVANARDAMERSGNLEILARPSDDARQTIISVSDSGHGIAPEHRQRVFEPFFTTKPEGSGTGLGLSQVYGFCRQAGGEARIESEPGVGTTVALFLPAASRGATSALSHPGTHGAPGSGHRTAAAR